MRGDRRGPRPPEGDRRELDPAASPYRWERSVASIVRAAAPELRRRAASPGVAGLIGRWARPLVAAAAALIVAASTALLWPAGVGDDGTGPVAGADEPGVGAGPAAPPSGRPGATVRLETAVYPAPVGTWMTDDDVRPTVEEIVFSASAERQRP